MNKFITLIGILFFSLNSSLARAIDPIYTGSKSSNTAIKGYDTVAYFVEGKPVKGLAEYSTKYKQATWLFSSKENLDLFLSSPEKYAPQYGGYCAYAVAKNKTAPIKPKYFTIHNEKLYLNYNKKINNKWLKTKDSYISKADQNWPSLLNK